MDSKDTKKGKASSSVTTAVGWSRERSWIANKLDPAQKYNLVRSELVSEWRDVMLDDSRVESDGETIQAKILTGMSPAPASAKHVRVLGVMMRFLPKMERTEEAFLHHETNRLQQSTM